jgi:exodeoxyribonuclease V alpha subunit
VQTELKGQIERITYANEENGYTIARMRAEGYSAPIVITGTLPSLSQGEELKLMGSWYTHPKYGEQFKVERYESIVPATAKGMERYLGSGMITGIGPVMAKRIVARFGDETLDVIEGAIERLAEVEGIGLKRVRMIKEAWEEQKEVKDVMLFLQGHGVSSAYATRIFKQYGHGSIKIVKENPYRLAHDVFGIGFKTADRIAHEMGIEKDAGIRAEAGVIYMINMLSDEGHVYYPYEPFVEECRKTLEVGLEIVLKALGQLAIERKIIIEDINRGELRENNKAVYLARYHISENEIAENIFRLLGQGQSLLSFDIQSAVEQVEKDLGIALAGKQKKAVEDSEKNKVFVITGGPGTGKTTILKAIIGVHKKAGRRILLGAPTGRAAKKMSEATGHEAKTIHRLLEYNPRDGGFKRNAENPFTEDLVVIDEVSMVDTVLMHHLLKAIPNDANLLLVGDVDQLPSVGAGNVLKDIIASGVVPTVRLKEIFRQARESHIITNAHRVNRGDMPVIEHNNERPQDFYFIQLDEPEAIMKKIISLCKEKIPERFKYDPLKEVQVLTPMHKGILGSTNLNAELQMALNPSRDELSRGGRVLRTGDKVMQVVNNYDIDVFNGDIGIVAGIDREGQKVEVDFDGRVVSYDFRDLDELILAYAVSVHKSQGSEYPVVVMPVHTQHYMLLQRNLLYTAITRGRELVVLVGTKKAVSIAVRNNKPRERHSRLMERLVI